MYLIKVLYPGTLGWNGWDNPPSLFWALASAQAALMGECSVARIQSPTGQLLFQGDLAALNALQSDLSEEILGEATT
jgi:hypothetical protein